MGVRECSREDRDDTGAKFVVADDGFLVFCLEPALFKTNNVVNKLMKCNNIYYYHLELILFYT